jgi:hypothetical protein
VLHRKLYSINVANPEQGYTLDSCRAGDVRDVLWEGLRGCGGRVCEGEGNYILVDDAILVLDHLLLDVNRLLPVVNARISA